jgi:hypothetical protein
LLCVESLHDTFVCFSFPGSAWERASRSLPGAAASTLQLATLRQLHFHAPSLCAECEELRGRAGRKQMLCSAVIGPPFLWLKR